MLRNILYCIPGAAIGYIIGASISQLGEGAALFSAAVLGSITGAGGKMLFLKSQIEGTQNPGFIRILLNFLVVSIVIVAGIILAAEFGLL